MELIQSTSDVIPLVSDHVGTCFTPIMSDLVKGIPAAIVALTLGVVASLIAYRQYHVARAKLNLDLFDKRYQIFLETWQALSEAAIKPLERRAMGTPFNNNIPRARFLFGPDVETYLEKASTHWSQLRAMQTMVESSNGRPEHAEQLQEIQGWFDAEAQRGVKLKFGMYMNFERWR
jgi:hypothetical protein